MADSSVTIGLTIPQRAYTFGAATVEDFLVTSQMADESGAFGAVFCGDSLLAKPRIDSIALLSAIAGRTKRVKLGTACMASFPLRHPVQLAYQWASLDVLSGGRTIMAACMGGGSRSAGGDFEMEFSAMGIEPGSRARRMEEGIEIMRLLWKEDQVEYSGQYYTLDEVSMGPKPVQDAPPIWIASNANLFTSRRQVFEGQMARIARIGDGWMTTVTPLPLIEQGWELIRRYAREEYGRDPEAFDLCIYLNININDREEEAWSESKRFLDLYYETDWSRDVLEMWGAYGSVESCLRTIRRYLDLGVTHVLLRPTTWDQRGMVQRCIDELLPSLVAART